MGRNKSIEGEMKKVLFILLILSTFIGFTGEVHANLTDLNNGLIYDSMLNVSWVQDVNFGGVRTF